MTQTNETVTNPSKKNASPFWAVVRYELLWNLRKKKVLAVLIAAAALEVLSLALTPLAFSILGQAIEANPDYVVTSGVPTFLFFFFGLVVFMNSISGEFENGTAIPLLTKPVLRTTIFLGKLSAGTLTLIPPYALLLIFQIVGGTMIYGSQNDLYLLPLTLIGTLISTMVWGSIVLAMGSVTKSSTLAAIVGFVVYFALLIISSVIGGFQTLNWVLTYLPGTGASGYLVPDPSTMPSIGSIGISTGTDSIASALVSFALHPSYYVAYVKIGTTGIGTSIIPQLTVLSTYPLWYALVQSIVVAFVYATVFLSIAWFALKKAQIAE